MSTRNSTTRRAVIVAAVVAFAVPTFFASGSVAADPSPLLASVSPNEEFLISLSNSDGTPVTHLDVGTYTVLVDDPATIHDFRLTGPGIDSTSGLEFVGKLTWTLTFKDGQYAYFCTPHRGLMHGHFSVGTGVAAEAAADGGADTARNGWARGEDLAPADGACRQDQDRDPRLDRQGQFPLGRARRQQEDGRSVSRAGSRGP